MMTHEFGHFLALKHTPVANCAQTAGSTVRVLCEDDKEGINQLYGPFTGFDGGRATGVSNYATFNANVTSSSLGVVSAQGGVNPWYGDKMLKIAGNATTSNNSYVFFKLFTIDMDSGADVGTLIPSGALLRWCQYNQYQTTMSIDATFSDGTSMRNYAVRDQYNVPVNPQSRYGHLNEWACYEANLDPVAGKVVNHWYIAFDGRSSFATSGTFQAYFDSIRMVWPGRSGGSI